MGWKNPYGATVEEGGIRFRVWAPTTPQVEVVVATEAGALEVSSKTSTTPGLIRHPMQRGTGGNHHVFVPGLTRGARYGFAIGEQVIPDPASRSQPDGVHALSEAIDPRAFTWDDDEWAGLDRDRLVIYELHVGTFTMKGTFDAAIARLDDLAELGVTAIEVMPIASFPGTRNWGYDGVSLFAPSANYGGPSAFKRFVDAAHRRGLGVILDVVYNHFGPDGNYLSAITGGHIVNDRRQTAWGAAVNYDGPESAAVRDFIVQNALYWAHEYHVDGVRLDAAHAMLDDSPTHILREIATALHSLPRPRIVIAEDDRNERRLLVDEARGGFGLDAVWADDLHHTLRRLAAGDDQGYYRSYRGTVDEVVETLRKGWLYEGQWSAHHNGPRGTPADGLPARAFIHCLQNHDQIGNRARGDRIHHKIPPETYRALSTLLLLSPYTPMLWMGQEWAASTPFQFFTDFPGELGRLVTEGRRREFQHFAEFEGDGDEPVPDPQSESTFLASRLCWPEREREPHKSILMLYRELLSLRASDPALQSTDRAGFEVHALGGDALAMRRDNDGASMLVLVQFGNATRRLPHEPAVWAMPGDRQWEIVLSTEHSRFGGSGAVTELSETGSVIVTGPGALVLRAAHRTEAARERNGDGASLTIAGDGARVRNEATPANARARRRTLR